MNSKFSNFTLIHHEGNVNWYNALHPIKDNDYLLFEPDDKI